MASYVCILLATTIMAVFLFKPTFAISEELAEEKLKKTILETEKAREELNTALKELEDSKVWKKKTDTYYADKTGVIKDKTLNASSEALVLAEKNVEAVKKRLDLAEKAQEEAKIRRDQLTTLPSVTNVGDNSKSSESSAASDVFVLLLFYAVGVFASN